MVSGDYFIRPGNNAIFDGQNFFILGNSRTNMNWYRVAHISRLVFFGVLTFNYKMFFTVAYLFAIVTI